MRDVILESHITTKRLLLLLHTLLDIFKKYNCTHLHQTVYKCETEYSEALAMSPLVTSHNLYPPFPSDITTAPLVSLSLAKLEVHDAAESEAFFKSCRSLGFFYLNMEGSTLGEHLVSEAEQLHKLQQDFFERPNDEKEVYAREKIDPFFGYRYADLPNGQAYENGRPKRNETYNVSSPFAQFQNSQDH